MIRLISIFLLYRKTITSFFRGFLKKYGRLEAITRSPGKKLGIMLWPEIRKIPKIIIYERQFLLLSGNLREFERLRIPLSYKMLLRILEPSKAILLLPPY